MEDYNKYTKEQLVEELTSLDTPITSFLQIPVRLCETLSCENCPVVLLNCDTRTKAEKALSHGSCQYELYKWLVRETRSIELMEDFTFHTFNTKTAEQLLSNEVDAITNGMTDNERKAYSMGIQNAFSTLNQLLECDIAEGRIPVFVPNIKVPTEMNYEELARYVDKEIL